VEGNHASLSAGTPSRHTFALFHTFGITLHFAFLYFWKEIFNI
jgi:hypothetical protein